MSIQSQVIQFFEEENKMLLELVQENFAILGICKRQSDRSSCVKALIGCLLLTTQIIIHLKFLFDEADNFAQYAESIFTTSAAIMALWSYITLIRNSQESFEFIEESEALLVLFRDSKFCRICTMFRQFSWFSERLFKCIYYSI